MFIMVSGAEHIELYVLKAHYAAPVAFHIGLGIGSKGWINGLSILTHFIWKAITIRKCLTMVLIRLG